MVKAKRTIKPLKDSGKIILIFRLILGLFMTAGERRFGKIENQKSG